ncbi:MAG: DMT family transporter [Candidatus Paceibacterota bacterium]|jgi:drug/metabolite transporter (DMT)-like permease
METNIETPKKISFSAGPLLIMIAAVLWGLDGVLRRSLYSLPPITIIFFEHLFGFVLLLPFVWKEFRTVKLSRKDWSMLSLVALLSGVLGTLFFTTALLSTGFISFSVVYLLQKLQPLFAISTARIFLKEKMNSQYYLWALLALLAAYFVTFPNGIVNFGTGAGTTVAALFAVGAAFAWGTSTTFSKIALNNIPASLATGLRFFLTSILAFLGVLALGKTASVAALTGNQALILITIALSTGMVALFIYYKGLKNTPVSVSTILELFYPLIAVTIDIALYDNILEPSQYFAALILVFAMYRVGKLASK